MTIAMDVYKEFVGAYVLGGECPICHQPVTGIVLRKTRFYFLHKGGKPRECLFVVITEDSYGQSDGGNNRPGN